MSRASIDIFHGTYIEKLELAKFVETLGAIQINVEDEPFCSIQNNGAAIWIYFEDEEKELSEFVDDLVSEFNLTPSVSIWLELSSDKEASEIALNFCLQLSLKYPDIIISDERGEYYRGLELCKLEVKDDWSWGFKNSL